MHEIRFAPEALQQLEDLEAYIAAARSPVAAADYVDSIISYCEALQHFPRRGTQRDDLRANLRTLGFRRRVTILFEVTDDVVNIIGIYYGGRDYEADLPEG